MESRQWEWLFW